MGMKEQKEHMRFSFTCVRRHRQEQGGGTVKWRLLQ